MVALIFGGEQAREREKDGGGKRWHKVSKGMIMW